MKKFGLKFQAFTSTLSCTLVLILIGVMSLAFMVAGHISTQLRENFIITLTLGGSNEMQAEEGLASQTASMQQHLGHERYVEELNLITADEVLHQQLPVVGNNPEEFLGFNPYFSEMEVTLKADYVNSDSLKTLCKEIASKYPLVSEVTYEKDLMDNLNRNLSKVAFILLTLTVLLALILFTLVNNFVHMSIYARRFHIQTMKLVGASYWFIRKPFMLRSLYIALIAGILANIVLVAFARCIIDCDETYSLYLTATDLAKTGIIVMLTGLVLLTLCTFFSVNHFIKMKGSRLHM